MKINVEFDLTPQEFRQAMGLPDVEAFQSALMTRIQEQMESGVEGYDPMSLMQTFLQQPLFKQGMQSPPLQDSLAQSLASFGSYQQMMLDMLRQAASSGFQDKREPQASGEDGAGAAKTKASTTQTKASTAQTKASASSRDKR